MAEDMILHGGNLTEFLESKRCEACNEKGRECIIKREADACFACSLTKKSRIFKRRALLRGSPKSFTHDLLRSKEDLQHGGWLS